MNSNFTSVFFKQDCHANSGADTKYAGSSSYISRHFQNFQTHLQAIVYHFGHISLNIHHNFLFQILPIPFGHVHNPHH